jgi:alpha-L-fucosidase 2
VRFAGGSYDNLFDAHPPFQIDGNFGGAAGIAEMLLQSHNGVIRLLPALPDSWPEGRVAGLQARGGVEVSIDWQEGKLTRATLRSLTGGPCRIRYGRKEAEIKMRPGSRYVLDNSLRTENK